MDATTILLLLAHDRSVLRQEDYFSRMLMTIWAQNGCTLTV